MPASPGLRGTNVSMRLPMVLYSRNSTRGSPGSCIAGGGVDHGRAPRYYSARGNCTGIGGEDQGMRAPREAEPMSAHTSFRIGGPADMFLVPDGRRTGRARARAARSAGVPVFLLGGGTNILVADQGIRGLVVDMGSRGHRGDPRKGSLRVRHADQRRLCSRPRPRALGAGVLLLASGQRRRGGVDERALLREGDRPTSCPSSRAWTGRIAGAETAHPRGTVGLQAIAASRPLDERRSSARCFRLVPGRPCGMRRRCGATAADREAKGHFLYPVRGQRVQERPGVRRRRRAG